MHDDVVGLFPGQGALRSGAGIAWRETAAWQITRDIRETTGLDVGFYLCEMSDEELRRTDRAQIATFALSVMSWMHAGSPRYGTVVGHSLGEYSALVAAGIISLDQASKVVAVRGAAMAEAAEREAGSMVALMGNEVGALEAVQALDGIWIANLNGESQTVVAGRLDALDYLLAHHKELGWRRATPLQVGGAFHSPLMAPAGPALRTALAAVTFTDGWSSVIANVDAQTYGGGNHWADLLERQLTSPVNFVGAIQALEDRIVHSVEAAPAGVLTGLTKRIRPFATQTNLELGADL